MSDGYHKTERFSVSMSQPELNQIDRFVARKGVTRNEFLRRVALAYIRCEESNFRVGLKQAWEDIGEGTVAPPAASGKSTGKQVEATHEG